MLTHSPLMASKQRLRFDWGQFYVGLSAFIPCIDRAEIAASLRKAATRQGYIVKVQHVIERDRYGVRIWRLL